MKKDKIAGTIGTTIFIIVVLVKEVVNPLDWRSLLILFGFFLIWGIIVSASLATFFDDREVSFFGIFKASSKQTSGKELKQRIDALDRQLKSLFNKIESSDRKAQKKITELNDKVSLLSNTLDIQNDKIGTMEAKLKTVEAESTDYHKSFQDLVYKITTPGISYVEKYKTPSEFQKLMDVVKSAKNDGYSVSDDSSYLECVKIVQGSIAYNLEMAIEFFYSQEQANEYKASIDDLSHIQPVPEKELHEIRKKIESEYGERTELISQFSQAISDLKKLQS